MSKNKKLRTLNLVLPSTFQPDSNREPNSFWFWSGLFDLQKALPRLDISLVRICEHNSPYVFEFPKKQVPLIRVAIEWGYKLKFAFFNWTGLYIMQEEYGIFPVEEHEVLGEDGEDTL